jgi:hypothetical protein
MSKARQTLQRLIAQWSELGIAHTPATLQLLNDKLAIKE